jgi:hypothetical protein
MHQAAILLVLPTRIMASSSVRVLPLASCYMIARPPTRRDCVDSVRRRTVLRKRRAVPAMVKNLPDLEPRWSLCYGQNRLHLQEPHCVGDCWRLDLHSQGGVRQGMSVSKRTLRQNTWSAWIICPLSCWRWQKARPFGADRGRHLAAVAVVMLMALGSCCLVTCCNCVRLGASIMAMSNARTRRAEEPGQGQEDGAWHAHLLEHSCHEPRSPRAAEPVIQQYALVQEMPSFIALEHSGVLPTIARSALATAGIGSIIY